MLPVRPQDLHDALDHAYEGEAPPLESFSVSRVDLLRLADVYHFDDVGAWAEWSKGELRNEEDLLEALTPFRGAAWATKAISWEPATMPPIVIVERADGFTCVGDGRGRVSYALGVGWSALPAVFLKERTRRKK